MMSLIKIENASVSFALFRADQRSLKKNLLESLAFGSIRFNDSEGFSIQSLRDINFTLIHGDRLGVIGPNGSGKSTLLRLIAGIYKPQKGSVKTEGNVTSIIEPGIGLDPFLTGYENIVSRIMLLTKGERKVDSQLIERVETISGLKSYLNLPVNVYSTGMTMRLNFAITIALEPEILLMDEWLSVTDRDFLQVAEEQMKRFVGQASIMVLASHDLELIRKVCTKVLVLDQGSTKYIGSVDDALNFYIKHSGS